MITQLNASLKNISAQDLLTFGLNDIAYLKPANVNGQSVFAIHAADGSQLALVANREVGVAAMQQHELEPVSLH
ncbi:MAG TPA: DUF1150 family protein [Alphaproteobacteria bacterium]|jgi:hypothetical protein|nr:DUF1150 family protein [Alphaproteobacteria bacterium]